VNPPQSISTAGLATIGPRAQRRRVMKDGRVLVLDRDTRTIVLGNSRPIQLPADVFVRMERTFRALESGDSLDARLAADPSYSRNLAIKLASGSKSRIRMRIGSSPRGLTSRSRKAAGSGTPVLQASYSSGATVSWASLTTIPSRTNFAARVNTPVFKRDWGVCLDLSLAIMEATADRNAASTNYSNLITGAVDGLVAAGGTTDVTAVEALGAALAGAYATYGATVAYDTYALNWYATEYNLNDCWDWRNTDNIADPSDFTSDDGEDAAGLDCQNQFAEVDQYDEYGDPSVIWQGSIMVCE
jgi:hypothetical protein